MARRKDLVDELRYPVVSPAAGFVAGFVPAYIEAMEKHRERELAKELATAEHLEKLLREREKRRVVIKQPMAELLTRWQQAIQPGLPSVLPGEYHVEELRLMGDMARAVAGLRRTELSYAEKQKILEDTMAAKRVTEEQRLKILRASELNEWMKPLAQLYAWGLLEEPIKSEYEKKMEEFSKLLGIPIVRDTIAETDRQIRELEIIRQHHFLGIPFYRREEIKLTPEEQELLEKLEKPRK